MIVWVLTQVCYHEGAEVRGVYSSKEKAEMEKPKYERYCDAVDIEEFEVQ